MAVDVNAYFAEVKKNLQQSFIDDDADRKLIEDITRCSTKALVRFLLSCTYAKLEVPSRDIRKPYTEIEGNDSFSGRYYDEHPIQQYLTKYSLPSNSTTAFLTPAFRNINRVLDTNMILVGSPKKAYANTIEILNKVYNGVITSENLFKEITRFLLIIKNENSQRISQLLDNIKRSEEALPLSSENIVTLLKQHLNCKNSSRLPVLIIASIYNTIKNMIGEEAFPLQAHNAADKQTGSLGDVEVKLLTENNKITIYEMKDKKVNKSDIDIALGKIAKATSSLDNYLFITTETIDAEVIEYANSFYEEYGVEITVLDCIGFAKHFLHLFHRFRKNFLDEYQKLVLSEPNSAVGQPLKEAFLALRQVAESHLE